MENIEDWRKAGKIAKECLELSKTLVKPGAKLLDVAEKIEDKIIESGAIPAFPVNISLNECAAHYTPIPNDELVFKDDLVKVDVGTCVNGAIGDAAITIDLSGKHSELVKAAKDALNNAIELVKEDASLGEIGKKIQETIQIAGFSPVKNLSGHGLELYGIHAKPSIPNYDTGDSNKIKTDVIAIEPFATYGKGVVKDSSPCVIFSLVHKRPVRDMFARSVLKEIDTFQGMPFCARWLVKKFPEFKVNHAIRLLVKEGILTEHSPLVEETKQMVSQAEKSMIVKEFEIIT